MKDKAVGLCHRCEHRAVYKETEGAPRHECGTDLNVRSCYMYEPVKPVVLKKNKGDKRPLFAGWMFSARASGVGLADFKLSVVKTKKGYALYWKPQ